MFTTEKCETRCCAIVHVLLVWCMLSGGNTVQFYSLCSSLLRSIFFMQYLLFALLDFIGHRKFAMYACSFVRGYRDTHKYSYKFMKRSLNDAPSFHT